MKVYLAGGLNSDWRDKVMREIPDAIYIDPRTHDLEDNARAYTAWDLLGVERCDVLFAYLERDNPSGIGMALEMGYAKAKGKPILLVDERCDGHTNMLRAAATVAVSTFSEGLSLLCRLVDMP